MKGLIALMMALSAVLATPGPAGACTGLLLTSEDRAVIAARTVDWALDDANHDTLVIKREGEPIEQIPLDGPGIVERTFTRSGDYTAHCIMKDGTSSQACEFSVCKLHISPVTEPIVLGKSWEIEFRTENMKAIHVQIAQAGDPNYANPVAPYSIWLNDEHRRQGRVTVPAAALSGAGKSSVSVTGENRYGRLWNRHVIDVVKPE